MQPAWTQEVLSVAHRQIRLRTFASAQELPLSWLPATASRHHGVFSSSWSEPQIDQNVQGGLLRAAGQPYGWGFGTQADHELEFNLPTSARTFRTRIGLDQLRSGGGWRGRVVIGGTTAFESPLLVGSTRTVDSGTLPIGATAPRRLVLVADAAAKDRPPVPIRSTFAMRSIGWSRSWASTRPRCGPRSSRCACAPCGALAVGESISWLAAAGGS